MTDRDAEHPIPSALPPLRPRREAIVVPRRHGEILIEPPVATAIRHLQSQTQRIEPADAWWDAIMQRARADILRLLATGAPTGNPSPNTGGGGRAGRPWVITGHQVEFYHAGVWAKVLLADHLAKLSGGTAVDILVDHDTVDRLGFALPRHNAQGEWEKVWHTWAPADAVAADGLAAPDSRQKESWCDEVLAAAAGSGLIEADALDDFIHFLQRGTQTDYVGWMDAARRQFETQFGLHVHHVRSSELCRSAAWAAFAGLWLIHADQWTVHYNQAIADYQARHHIKSPSRPMPPLAVSESILELPFWIYHRGRPRERLLLDRRDRSIVNTSGRIRWPEGDGDQLQAAEQFQQVLETHQLCIRPRALTLTMYVRTFLADAFIHGIGGAMYDEMTDQIASAIGLPIGGYLCASAGWLLPAGRTRQIAVADLARLTMRHHHLRHNPQLVYQHADSTSQAAALLAERQQLIAALSVRSDRRDPAAAALRTARFRRLHAVNAQCIQMSGELERLDRAMAETRAALRREQVLGDREYFFALHGQDSLRELQRLLTAG